MRIVVLTGAGISAESGVPTFRDADGLWEGHRIEDVATPDAFDRNPVLVHEFYDLRRAALDRVEPNPAHRALARLEKELGDDLFLVTQNIDDLHERGGSQRVVHMHGELRQALCAVCRERTPWEGPLLGEHPCPGCERVALRPDVVWFGEMPYRMDEIYEAIHGADLFVAIGTSGAVYPAAGFVFEALGRGIPTLEINLKASEGTAFFTESWRGAAATVVPLWVDAALGGSYEPPG